MEPAIHALQCKILSLWPDYERQESALGPLCFLLSSQIKIQSRGKKGQGIKGWCLAHGIDLNRFNYLVRKFKPEAEKKTQRRARPTKRTTDVIENYTNPMPPNFEQVRALVKRVLAELPTDKQLEELANMREWVNGQIMDLQEETQKRAINICNTAKSAQQQILRVALRDLGDGKHAAN